MKSVAVIAVPEPRLSMLTNLPAGSDNRSMPGRAKTWTSSSLKPTEDQNVCRCSQSSAALPIRSPIRAKARPHRDVGP